MQLYNTLTRKLEHFTPLIPLEAHVYTCGPTVYDYPHIGNFAAFIRWDTLVRILQEQGYAVEWVMNITDVGHLTSDADEGEDKLEKGARRDRKSAWEVAQFYTNDFIESLQKLNIATPSHLAKATDHIPQQIALIKKLEQKGYTYTIDDGVYFNTTLLSDYGKLIASNHNNEQKIARVKANTQKINPADFALWKFTPANQKRDMEWDSPWGKGFPGWHIECSAMAMQYLGETIDIHAGGIDHIPVHHTNEIAQSEAATGKQFANYWLHSNFINVEGIKISKSLGTGITLQEVEKAGFKPLDVRMLYLQSHYRSHANFTWGGLQAAGQRLSKLRAFADLRFQTSDAGQIRDTDLQDIKTAILQELTSDMRTPEALAALSDIVAAAETDLVHSSAKQEFTAFITFLDRIFGLNLLKSHDISQQQKQLITQRQSARAKKDYAAADKARDILLEQGVEIRDTPVGAIWNKAT